MAYRGAICNQKGCPMDHWIIEKSNAKIKFLNPEIRKLLAVSPFQDGRIDYVQSKGSLDPKILQKNQGP